LLSSFVQEEDIKFPYVYKACGVHLFEDVCGSTGPELVSNLEKMVFGVTNKEPESVKV
jgi:hypothetical protein